MAAKRKQNPWAREEVIDYVLDSYGGAEENARGKPKRVFIWADDDGDVWIGNSVAFAEHCSELFGFRLLKFDYVAINRIMLGVGERLLDKRPRKPGNDTSQLPMKPEKRRAGGKQR